MHLFDVIALIVILYSIVRGYFRGLLREAFNLLGIILGGLIAVKTNKGLASFFTDVFKLSPAYGKVTAFILVWILVYLLFFFCGLLIQKIFKVLLLEWMDKSLGIVFGLLKSYLTIGLVVISLLKFPFLSNFKEEVDKTLIVRHIAKSTPVIYNTMIDMFSGEKFENYENLIKAKNVKSKIIEKEDMLKDLLENEK